CRNLEAVLEERDQPTDEDHYPQRMMFELQVAIPCERHKYVRNRQQHHRAHTDSLKTTRKGKNRHRPTRPGRLEKARHRASMAIRPTKPPAPSRAARRRI